MGSRKIGYFSLDWLGHSYQTNYKGLTQVGGSGGNGCGGHYLVHIHISVV